MKAEIESGHRSADARACRPAARKPAARGPWPGWLAARVSLAVALAFLCATAARADEFTRVSHYRVRLFSLGTFTIQTRTGDIHIEGWDDPHVSIEAEKLVRASSAKKAAKLYKRIKIKLDGVDEDVRLRTIYPPRRLWRPFRGESKLTVNFRIKMPYDAKLVLRTVDGDVWVTGVVGNEDIFVNYGDVEIDLPSARRVHSLHASTFLGTIQSDLRGEDVSGFDPKAIFWNPDGRQDVNVHVRMGGIWIYSGN